MPRTQIALLLAVLIFGAQAAPACLAQQLPPPAPTLPGDPMTFAPAPAAPAAPPPPALAAAVNNPADLPAGWFGIKEIDAVRPDLSHSLSNTVFLRGTPAGVSRAPFNFNPGNIPATVNLSATGLNWAPAPRIEFGYRFADGGGALIGSVFALDSQGSGVAPGFDPFAAPPDGGGAPSGFFPSAAGAVKSRLDLVAVDFDYGNRFYDLDPRWVVLWRAGVRFASWYFDTRVQGPALEQRASSYLFGVGPHSGVDLYRRLTVPGLSLFGRAEGAALIGWIDQNFEETLSAAGVPFGGGATRITDTRYVPTLRAQAGLRWSPWPERPFAVSAGYIFGGWWTQGQGRTSAATLIYNGVFLRGEWAF
jgi:hypothetical protein